MRRCLKGLGGRPTSTDGFILGPVTRLSGSACFLTVFCRVERSIEESEAILDAESKHPYRRICSRAPAVPVSLLLD